VRTYQHIGLKSDAIVFLQEHAAMVPDITCPDCGKVVRERFAKNEYDTVDATYATVSLHEYVLRDGRMAREIMQCMPWSAGPMGFLCLEVEGQLLFEWTEEEIAEQE